MSATKTIVSSCYDERFWIAARRMLDPFELDILRLHSDGRNSRAIASILEADQFGVEERLREILPRVIRAALIEKAVSAD